MNVYYFCFSNHVTLTMLKEKQKDTEELSNVRQLFLKRQVLQTEKVFTMESTSYEKAASWIIDIWLPKVQGLLFPKEDIAPFLEENKIIKEYVSKNGIHYLMPKKDTTTVLSIVRCTKNMALAGRKIQAARWVRTS